MPVPLEDRPTDTVREEVIDQLIMNYAHGIISEAAFERRLSIATDSQDNREIADQAKDLELKVDDKYVNSKKSKMTFNHSAEPVDEEDKILNVLGSNDRSGLWRVPKRLKLFSLMGGSNLDFTDAEFCHPTMTIDITCILGGETIYVPEGVNVISKAFAVLGSIENSTPSTADRNAPTIVIEGTVVLGSVEVKVKRTMKERFQAFAESFKQMLQ